ncbi:MAG: hypothetical protein KJ737_04480 [Proteobacteria bacterium]|nr:hypothetical protein [Pseudomonadota bacterium]
MKQKYTTKDYLKICFAMMVLSLAMAIPQSVFAMTAPAAGSFGYDVYDIVVNNMSKGAIGFGVGVVGVVSAGLLAWKQQFPAMLGTLAATGGLVKADAIINTFGALI